MIKNSGLILALFLVVSQSLFSQKWIAVDKKDVSKIGLKDIQPSISKTYFIDDGEIKNILWTAPQESEQALKQSTTIINVPLADGKFDKFKIVSFDMMEEGLKAKYPNIKTVHGISITNPLRTIRADYTDYGFRAMIIDEKGNTYIDHFQRGDKNHKIVYFKKDLVNINPWACDFESDDERPHENTSGSRAGDCIFRSYRLAVSTTAEYSNFHGATSSAQSALVMSAVVVVINRVNGVLEHDIPMRYLLVSNTNLNFYYTASTDPFTNGNGGTMLGENQTVCDNNIGSANYDMGHVFSTGGGGVAYLNCICNASNKAGGVTGQPSPIGDPFSIDYVAHEMGHQLGGNHTQNNNCNRNNATAIEPGSASSIMGYAGICAPNVQNNSDAYYHAVNIAEIKNAIQPKTCHVVIPFTNGQPVVAALTSRSIPKSTPFFLTASATDPDGDPITYCWEQTNIGNATMPPVSTNTTGPTFRTNSPISSPIRYFPPLANVIANTANTWEVLPSVGRVLNFRATARDYHTIAGCTAEQNMTVTTVAASGPFLVTSQNSATTWAANSAQTITWDVANTTASPVSCANVDIFLSTDGGLTYPITLIANTPNDGTESITVPNNPTSTGRVMVKSNGNVFYDINNTNITIQQSIATFNISVNPSIVNLCNTSNATTTVSITPLNGFNSNVTLSASNLPPGAVATFTQNPVSSNGSTNLTISNLFAANGSYNIIVQGISGSLNKTTTLTLDISSPLAQPTLSIPINGATNVALFATLGWQAVSGANVYNYEVSLSPTFTFLAASGISNTTSATLANNLTGNSTYYWRVSASNNCGNNPWSDVQNFSTSSCFYYNATDVPKAINPSTVNTITSSIKLFDSGRLASVDVFNLEGTHTNISNLEFKLESTFSGIQTIFWDSPCSANPGNDDDFDINFSDNFSTSYPCPPTNGQTYGPANPFTNYLGVSSYGNWKLYVKDNVVGDGGSLNKWAVQACYLSNFCRRLVDHPYKNGIGSLYDAINCAETNDTITISSSLKNLTINLENLNLLIQKNVTIFANVADNITIASDSNNPTIVVSPGVTLNVVGLNLRASNATAVGAISNEGILSLKNANVYRNPSVSPSSLCKNIGTGTITFSGNCNLKQ